MITSVAGRKASFAEKILPPFLGVSAIRDQKGPGVSREGENLLISAAAACRPSISRFSLGDQLAQLEFGCRVEAGQQLVVDGNRLCAAVVVAVIFRWLFHPMSTTSTC
jgi:hypothetical protein